MDLILFLSLLAVLLTSIFWIIPTYAPPGQVDTIKNLVGLSFPALLLGVAVYQTRLKDKTLILPIVFYGIVAAVCISGIYWWIPRYVPVNEQHTATTWLFNSVTLAIILANSTSGSLKLTYA